MTEQPRLQHLLDRLRRGVLLEAEGEQLVGLVGDMEAERDAAQARLAVPDRTTLPDLHRRIVDALTVAYPDAPFDADDLGHLVLAIRDRHVEQLEQRIAELATGQRTHRTP